MSQVFRPVLSIKWKLLLTIFLTLFIPVVWKTIRMHFIGSMPNSYAFSAAGNLQWINVMFEVLEEAFLLPLFFIFAQIFKAKDGNENKKVIGKLYIIAIIYIAFIIAFIIATPQLLKQMSPFTYNGETISFIRFEFGNRLFIMFIKVCATILILRNMWKTLISLLLVQMVITVFTDIFVISNLKVSFKAGVKGIAIDDLISNSFMSIIYLTIICKTLKIKWSDVRHPIFSFRKRGTLQIIFSGAESLIRNAFFIIFVIKIINRLGSGYNQGDYWTTNAFIWDWLLLPIIALGQYANRDSALSDNSKSFWQRYGGMFIITTAIVALWLIFMPTYEGFVREVFNNKRADIINHLVFILIGFYVLFAYNNIIDKSLYGEGRAELMLIQSIITNVVVYISFYYSVTTMTLELVAIMFGVAIAVDSLLTFIMFALYKLGVFDKIYKRKENKNECSRKSI